MHKSKSFYFKDFANVKRSFICYLSSKEMFTKREQVLKEMFSFYVSKSPLWVIRGKPYPRRWSRLPSGLRIQTFSDVWMYGWVAPICLCTSALRVKATQGPKWILSFWILSFEEKSFESMILISLSACHCITWTIWNCFSCIHVKCFVRFTCCTYWAL